MITAICPNPSIDRELHLHDFKTGGTNRVEQVIDIAGGKGINVAMAATALGSVSNCIGFLPFDGRELITGTLDRFSISYEFTGYPGSVRVNQKVRDLSVSVVTELNSSGPAITPDVEACFFELAKRSAEKSDIIVMSGSLPKGTGDRFYSRLVRQLSGTAKCVVDAGGKLLAEVAAEAPYLVKPNRDEIEQFSGHEVNTKDEIVTEARKLISRGIRFVAVSLGADGAMIVDGSEAYFAKALKIDVGSTVGAGDAMVAGMCVAIERELEMSDILSYGIASAARWICAKTSPESFDDLLKKIDIQRI